MSALLLTLALFLYWSLLGVALLAAVRADTGSQRILLTAPAIGLAVILLPAFAFSQGGLATGDVGIPLAIVLGLTSIAVLAWRRPSLTPAALPVLGICLVALILVGTPMLDFGLHWLGNGNDDMANYVFGGIRLEARGYRAPLDVAGLVNGTDYADAMKSQHGAGARAGAELSVALVSTVTRLKTYAAFMPTILAIHLIGLCSVGALALQATRRIWAAWVAAALLALWPMATYGVVQQLIAQVLGLALGTALAAILMRRDAHHEPGNRLLSVVPVALLAGGLALAYPEAAAVFGVTYGLWLGLALVRREVQWRGALRLLLSALGMGVVLLGPYAIGAVRFFFLQSGGGLRGGGEDSLFGFMLIPSALPGSTGLLTLLPPPVTANLLDEAIIAAALILITLVAISISGSWRGEAAALLLLVQFGLAVVLVLRGADFGLLKLTMWMAPAAAAAVAAWLSRGPRWRMYTAGAPVLAIAVCWVSTQRVYVDASRNPLEVQHFSADDQLPKFRAAVEAVGARPLLSTSDNIILQKLQAAAANGHHLDFISRDPVDRFLSAPDADARTERDFRRVTKLDPWRERVFWLGKPGASTRDTFDENVRATSSLAAPDCRIAMSTRSQNTFNGRVLPASFGDLALRPCRAAKNVLVFTFSSLGQHYYLPANRRMVSYYQLENDPYRPGATFSGFGRYALFRVLNPTPSARLVLDFTTTIAGDGVNRVPPVRVIGDRSYRLAATGRGGARVVSPPLRPRLIAGVPYLLVDMGNAGQPAVIRRSGVRGLWGGRVRIDPRRLTARMRDISLISGENYDGSRVPASLGPIRESLANPAVQYSGFYDDGWIGENASVVLSNSRGAPLRIEGTVPAGFAPQTLEVRVGGRLVARRALKPGQFHVEAPVRGGGGRSRVELRFSKLRRLPRPDNRPVSVLLSYIGFPSR